MNLNKDPESWARVAPDAVIDGSKAQAENVLRMALEDIGRLGNEVDRLRNLVRGAYNEGFSQGMREHTTHSGGKPWNESAAQQAIHG